jgi:hypothetical protein
MGAKCECGELLYLKAVTEFKNACGIGDSKAISRALEVFDNAKWLIFDGCLLRFNRPLAKLEYSVGG